MKKLLPISIIVVIAAVVMIACNRQPQAGANGRVLTYTDTLGLADFQKWKTQNELKDPTVYYNQGTEIASNQPTRTIVKYVPVKSSTTHRSTSRSSGSGSMNSVSQYPAKTLKKGWSRKAKGAVIGGGSGAILGAVINKNNRLVGGALGGALGAGIGYVIGNELDRKHGR
jgi:YmgG-like glycine-zipper protein